MSPGAGASHTWRRTMTDRMPPKRTIIKLPKGDRRWYCNQFRRKPFRPCLERGEYQMVVEVEGSETRKPYTMHYTYCEKHVPWHKVQKSAADRPELPGGAITTQEAADLIGIPITTLHGWRRTDKGPKSVKARGRRWYSSEEVERYAEAYRIVNGGPDGSG